MRLIARFYKELRRRQMFGVVAIYLAGAWGIIEVVYSDVVQDMFDIDPELVLFAAIIGLPFAVIAGWFYDFTTKGIFRTPAIGAEDSYDLRLKSKDLAFLAALLVTWAVAVYAAYIPPAPERSIAMLVFDSPDRDEEVQKFAEQLRNDLHNHVGKVATFLSISPVSVDKLNRAWPGTRIAKQLGVAYLLAGTMDRAGNVVVVSPRLIDGRDGAILWIPDQPFNREPTLDARYDIRTEIAVGIARTLGKRLSSEELEMLSARPTASQAASDEFVRGRELLERRKVVQAAAQFDAAIEADPVFAEAHAELAIALMLSADAGMLLERGYEEAKDRIDRALELNPNLAEAHAAKGFYQWEHLEIDESLESLRRAIEIDPTYQNSYLWMANIYRSERGEYEAEFRLREELVQRSPYHPSFFINHVAALISRGRLVEAQERIDEMRVVDPLVADGGQQEIDGLDGNWASYLLWALKMEWRSAVIWTLVAVGLNEEAMRVADSADEWDLQLTLTIGDQENRENAIRKLLQDDSDPNDPQNVQIGVALASVGNYDKARPYLESWWRGRNQVISGDDANFEAQALIAARRDVGAFDGADEVIEALKKNVRRLRAAGITVTSRAHSVDYLEGMTLYFAGEHDEGLELIAKAASDGFFVLPPEAFAFQASLAKEPALVRILEDQTRHQTREREKVLKVVCTDNPYADLWSPLPETC